MTIEKYLEGYEDLKKYAIELDVFNNINLGLVYHAFYEQHKLMHGSFKKYISNPKKYSEKMQSRYNWMHKQSIDVINETYKLKQK